MFIALLGAVLGFMHLYLWQRLIKDTTRRGRTRWILTAALVALIALLFAALILPRIVGGAGSTWLSWPGYLWFGLVGYLFLTLLVLEPVRLVLRGWAKRRPSEVSSAPAPVVDESLTLSLQVDRRLFLARAGAATALGPPDILRLPVRLRGLDAAFSGFRIGVVSDIHLGPLTGRAQIERI